MNKSIQKSIRNGGRREMLQRTQTGIVTRRLLVVTGRAGLKEAAREREERGEKNTNTRSGGGLAQCC